MILVVFAFYNRDHLYRTNMNFFIQHGSDVKEMDVVVVVNGTGEELVPRRPNVTVLVRPNDDFDFGAFWGMWRV